MIIENLILTLTHVLVLFSCQCTTKPITSSNKNFDNLHIVEGDILVSADFGISGKGGLNGDRFRGRYWKNRILPYQIASSDFNVTEKQIILDAIKEINTKTCVKLVERTNERDYVYVFSGIGFYSLIGREGGQQPLSFQRGNLSSERLGELIHEFLHALGIFHEQNRPDRDKYIRVLWHNIKPDWYSLYTKQTEFLEDTFDVPYDYGSVMHIDQGAGAMYTRDNKTMEVIDESAKKITLGQRYGLSPLDIKRVNAMYKC